MLWRTLECLGGAGNRTGERSWGKKNYLRIVRHKNALKKYLMEGIWQILEHQQ